MTTFPEFIGNINLDTVRAEFKDTDGNSPTLQSGLARFFPKLGASKTTALALKKCTANFYNTKPAVAILKSTFLPLFNLFSILYPNTKTRQRVFADLRQIIRTKYGENSVAYKTSRKELSITYEEFDELKEKAINKRDSANQNKKQFNLQNVLDIMARLVPSARFEDEVILCQLASGARLIEILRESEFERVDGNPYLIRVIGVAKKKQEVIFQKPLVYITSDIFLEKINDLRKLSLDTDDRLKNEQLTSMFDTRVNKRIKELGLNATTHTLRKIYGQLSYSFWADKNSISENEWLKAVLGHSSTTTSLHYTNVSVSGDLKNLDQINARVSELQAKVSGIEEKFEKEPPSETVKFRAPTGFVYLKKYPRQRIGTDAQLKKVESAARLLRENGIAVTSTNLRKLGIGAQYAKDYLDAQNEL